ncbi:hypothetical protein M8C21_023256 [Ambrosia artemisiifolia]|uniref:F-box/FBD/LRR-repeat protein n=1 Tax=Ambrosia artemisiifolia TaxID=4212 RepID=A0AAD5D4Z4_AMBAR|nr:hypothetical protein M8C21_023256 [Ambrosia artemisiifolia]
MDLFKKLPHSIIENILCLIPIKDAARTSILSKEWRYHWTKIPKLVLDEDMFEVPDFVNPPPLEERVHNILSQKEGKSYWCKIFYAFYQILLKHEGPIHEFTLRFCEDEDCVEIELILCYLSRNYSVKKLTLDLSWGYVLHLSVFSFYQLIDLRLIDCKLGDGTITFNAFDSLTNLCLKNVDISKKMLLHLLSNCPLLKSLTLVEYSPHDYNPEGYTVTNLFECFPTVEKLSICFSIIVDRILQSQKCSSILEDCSDILLEHLNELEILDLTDENKMAGLDFVKFILAKSPMLKKVRITLPRDIHKDDELQVVLLSLQRASPMA